MTAFNELGDMIAREIIPRKLLEIPVAESSKNEMDTFSSMKISIKYSLNKKKNTLRFLF